MLLHSGIMHTETSVFGVALVSFGIGFRLSDRDARAENFIVDPHRGEDGNRLPVGFPVSGPLNDLTILSDQPSIASHSIPPVSVHVD